jgi:hypothetical protein
MGVFCPAMLGEKIFPFIKKNTPFSNETAIFDEKIHIFMKKNTPFSAETFAI